MAERTIKVKFTGETGDFEKSVKVVDDGLEKTEKHGSKLGSTLGDIGKTAAGFAIGGGLLSAPGFFLDAAKAAMEDEQSTARLQQAIKNLGGDYEEQLGQVNDAISAGQKLGFSDDQVRDSYVKLSSATGDHAEALKRQRLAMDLARGANIDLETASKLLGKVTDENVNVLSKMGIRLEKGASEAELFGAVQEKFGGQADAFAKSTAGQFAILQDRLGEAKETIGYALLPVMAALAGVLAEDVVPIVEELAASFQEKVLPAIEDVGAFVEEHVMPPLERLGNWFIHNKDAMAAVAVVIGVALVAAFTAWAVSAGAAAVATIAAAAPVIAVTVAIAALVVGITLLVRHWGDLEAKYPPLTTATETVKAGFQSFATWITEKFIPAVKSIAETVTQVVGEAVGFVKDHWHEIEDVIRPALDAVKVVVETAFSQVKTEIETVLGVIQGIVDVFMGVFTGDWERAWNGVKKIVSSVWTGIKETIENAIGLIKGLGGIILDAGTELGSKFVDGLVGGLKGIANFVGDIGGAIKSALHDALQAALNWVTDHVRIPIPEIDLGPLGSYGGGSIGFPRINVPGFALGGIAPGGLAMVGERGPELVALPRGSRVFSNAESRAMAGGGANLQVHIHGDVYARDEAEARTSAGSLAFLTRQAMRTRGMAV